MFGGPGTKRWVIFAQQKFPAIQVSDSWSEDVVRPGRSTLPRRQYADLISLRTTNPANGPVREFVTMTPESLAHSPLRLAPDDRVVGLDVTEDGTAITFSDLQLKLADSIIERQAQRAAFATPQRVEVPDED